jgi:alginate O-acetyltransferase complex protein AlgI
MLFNSWEFLVLFLPMVLLVGLVILRGTPRSLFLVAASFMFYAVAGVLHAIVLFSAILWVYAIVGRGDSQVSLGRAMWASTFPFAILVYFKYWGFFVQQLLHPLGVTFVPLPEISDQTLPAGVSFFTFQLISYAIDRKRGLINMPPSLTNFSLLIGFFPHLVAGPILRYRDVARGLVRMPFWRLTLAKLPTPLTYIVGGLTFKVLVADRLAATIASLTKDIDLLSRVDALFVVWAFSFQIYFDFYGYSLIAIGIGMLFGLNFPANFDRPYSSLNPREFWRRWHITLSYWIRDYVYIPLGGNRRYLRNILITFALFGLWHGAGWNYVIWGLYNAALVLLYHSLHDRWGRMPQRVQMAATFSSISLGWLLFLFDLPGLLAFGRQIVAPASPLQGTDGLDWAMLLVAALVSSRVRIESIAVRACESRDKAILWGAGMAFAIIGVFLFIDLSNVFIYFRF